MRLLQKINSFKYYFDINTLNVSTYYKGYEKISLFQKWIEHNEESNKSLWKHV